MPVHPACVRRSQIKALRTSVGAMHGDVVRLNTLIAQNEQLSKKLAETNFSLEKEFVVELKVRCCALAMFGKIVHWDQPPMRPCLCV